MRVITVPDSVGGKLVGVSDEAGGAMRDMRQYVAELNRRFEFRFVDPADLSRTEKEVWDKTAPILKPVGAQHLAGGMRVSETMRPGHLDADGIWDGERIIIKRSALETLGGFAGVLLHEAAHATSGRMDVTRDFEDELTRMLGSVAALALRHD